MIVVDNYYSDPDLTVPFYLEVDEWVVSRELVNAQLREYTLLVEGPDGRYPLTAYESEDES